jgi:hypothetical protein
MGGRRAASPATGIHCHLLPSRNVGKGGYVDLRELSRVLNVGCLYLKTKQHCVWSLVKPLHLCLPNVSYFLKMFVLGLFPVTSGRIMSK